jgi:hypothetical protein
MNLGDMESSSILYIHAIYIDATRESKVDS